MKTYNQTVDGKSFDWNKFLASAIAGTTTGPQRDAANQKAASWVTCACGNQCSVLERDADGEPQDSTLSALGCQFMDDIDYSNYKAAKKTLANIEKRSAYLIGLEVKKYAVILANLGYKVVPSKQKA